MGFLTGIFSKAKDVAVKDVVDSVGDAIDKVFTSKEEKARVMLDVEKEVNRHIEFFAQSAQKDFELEVSDRERATRMQIEALHQEDKFSKRFLYYLASFLVLSATGFGLALCFINIPDSNRHIVENFSFAYLFSGALVVVNFFFGATKRDHDKGVVEQLKSKL